LMESARHRRSTSNRPLREAPMLNALVAVLLAVICWTAAAVPALAASIRNVYFSNGATVPGQRYRSEGELPGPAKEFTKGTDKVARLFIVFGDLDAHKITGELKAADGKVVSRLDRQWASYTGAGNVQWRTFTHGFNLERLPAGEYKLELGVDDNVQG